MTSRASLFDWVSRDEELTSNRNISYLSLLPSELSLFVARSPTGKQSFALSHVYPTQACRPESCQFHFSGRPDRGESDKSSRRSWTSDTHQRTCFPFIFCTSILRITAKSWLWSLQRVCMSRPLNNWDFLVHRAGLTSASDLLSSQWTQREQKVIFLTLSTQDPIANKVRSHSMGIANAKSKKKASRGTSGKEIEQNKSTIDIVRIAGLCKTQPSPTINQHTWIPQSATSLSGNHSWKIWEGQGSSWEWILCQVWFSCTCRRRSWKAIMWQASINIGTGLESVGKQHDKKVVVSHNMVMLLQPDSSAIDDNKWKAWSISDVSWKLIKGRFWLGQGPYGLWH
jgi:hypothetical protein